MPAKGKYLLNEQNLKQEALYRKFSGISQYQPFVLLLGLSMLTCATLLVLFFSLKLVRCHTHTNALHAYTRPQSKVSPRSNAHPHKCALLNKLFKIRKDNNCHRKDSIQHVLDQFCPCCSDGFWWLKQPLLRNPAVTEVLILCSCVIWSLTITVLMWTGIIRVRKFNVLIVIIGSLCQVHQNGFFLGNM